MQIVEYAAIPNTREHEYLPTITKILAQIQRQEMFFKEFRDYLKEHAIWDKESWPVVWNLLEIKVGEKILLGEFAKRIAGLDDDDELRKQLFLRVVKRNEILFKYVFEALDERLHSTHELYRLITSYVYPGEYITLVNFQNWVKWMAALGYIKFIGIRWGLTELGRGELSRAKMIDVEELLEDERLEREAAASRKEAPEAAPADDVRTDSAPTASAEPALDAADDADEDEDLPDMPPSPVVPVRVVEERESVEPQSESPAPARTAVRAPSRTAEPIPRMAPRRFVIPEISREDLAANAERIKAWWAGYADKKAYQLTDFGLTAESYAADKAQFLFKAACIGRLVVFDDLSPIYYEYIAELNGRRFFERLWAEEPVSMLLGEVDYFSHNPWYLRASEMLIYVMAYRHRLKSDEGLVAACESARNGKELIRLLHQKLYGGVLSIEPFWIVREMARLGLWDNPAFETVAIVPTYSVRENMFRIGFLSSMYADQLDALIDASETLSRYFGSEDNFEGPLAQFADGQGCAFRCNRVNVCPFACREKFAV